MADSLEERRFELDAEIKRRELAIKEAEATKKTGLTTAQATIAGAALALISGISGALISASSTKDIEGDKALSSQAIEKVKVDGTLNLEKVRQEATLALEQKKFETSLIFEAIKTPSREDSIRNLQFFVTAGFISDKDGRISKLPLDKLPSSPPPTVAPSAAASPVAPISVEAAVIPADRRAIAQKIVSAFADAGYGSIQQAAALANAIDESGLDPALKRGSERGLFSLGGSLIARLSDQEAMDPDTNIRIMISEAKMRPRFEIAQRLADAVSVFVLQVSRPSNPGERISKQLAIAEQILQNSGTAKP